MRLMTYKSRPRRLWFPGHQTAVPRRRAARNAAMAAMLAIAAIAAQACGQASQTAAAPPVPEALLNGARPVGVGPGFRLPVTGLATGPCERSLGPRTGVHVEVFAGNRVVLLPAGIGTRPPRALLDGRVTRAGCYGALVTLDPTGLVLIRSGTRLTVGALFRSWGQPLSPTRLASFPASEGTSVTAFVDGRPWPGPPGEIPLTAHAEIVLEVGPHVPPHSSYVFPPGT